MSNIHDSNFNKNVSMVYTEEYGFTGYKGLEWNKLDNVEDLLREGVAVSGLDVALTTTNLILSGIKSDTTSVDHKLFVTGDPYPAGVQGTIVMQADLSAQFDNIDIAGYAGADISGIKENLLNGVDVNIKNFGKETYQIDAFGRQRISQPYTLADYSHVYGEETELLSKTNGANSKITFDINKAKAILMVGGGENDFAIHQSRMYHHYMPGKSQLTFQSFNFTGHRNGTNKRIGLFDDYNGIFFMQSGDGTLGIVLRNNVSGYIYDDIVWQNNWNIDTCKGTGISKFNLDPTKTQLFTSDFQWLGVGRVRAGFVHDGNSIIAHEFYNSNNKSSVYWSNPNLPIRCEIRNYSTTVGIDSMDQICATVMSEGGYNEAGVDFSASTTSPISIDNTTKKPLIAIRLKTGYYGKPNRSIVRLGQSSIFSATKPVAFEFWRLTGNANIIGGSWVSANNESVVEYNTTATSITTTSGLMLNMGYVSAGGPAGNSAGASNNFQSISSAKRGYISQNIDSTESNIFAIAISGLDTTTNVYGGMQWRETR